MAWVDSNSPMETPSERSEPVDAESGDDTGTTASGSGGETPDSDDFSSDELLWPPITLVIDIPLDRDNIPSISYDGGAPDWLIEAALAHLLDRMRKEMEAEELELSPNTEEDE